MGKTYKKQPDKYDDFSSGRSGKHGNHANGKKTGGMKTLNSYVEYDDDSYDAFDDEIEMKDDINIQHILKR
jgi:hypothetical protein